MLRFIKHNLTGIDGVEIYPLLSLLIFVLFFAFVITYVIRMKKPEIDTLGGLPLEDGVAPDVKDEQAPRRMGFGKHGTLILLLLIGGSLHAQEGEKLFKSKCNVCHMLGKNSTGPKLEGVKQKWIDAGEQEFLYQWVQNSEALVATGKSKMATAIKDFSPSAMTPQDVTPEQVDAILDYVDNPPPPPVNDTMTNPGGGEIPVVIVPNYEKNLNLFYILCAAIILQLIVILVITNSTRSMVEMNNEKQKKDKGGSLTNWLVLIGILGLGALSNPTYALNFIEAGENVEGPWLLVEDSDIYFLVAINLILLVLIFHFRGLFMDIARMVRPHQTERVSKRKQRKLNKLLTDVVPIEEEHTILMHHEYDGIKELDNNLPPWWVWGFYTTILFAVVYLFHYHILHTGDLQAAEYDKAVAEGQAEVSAYLEKMAMNVDETNVTLLTEKEALAQGKIVFNENCILCHNTNGAGTQNGPNLTDKSWIYGYDIKDVFTTVKKGRPGGMPEHNSKLNPVQMQQVASFVLSLPEAEGREPQGEFIEK
jgi:cytochrome c oxidase cbb3-type subunit 3